MRVRANNLYRYEKNGFDRFHPTPQNNLLEGQIVKVINLPSAPKANTMGQCYVADAITGKFICMVATASLNLPTAHERMNPELVNLKLQLAVL